MIEPLRVREVVQEMANHLLETYEGRDPGVPDKLIGVILMVIDAVR